MKPTMGILASVMIAGLAWAQNPNIIQKTRTAMQTVQKNATAASNEALGKTTPQPAVKVSAPASVPVKSNGLVPQGGVTSQGPALHIVRCFQAVRRDDHVDGAPLYLRGGVSEQSLGAGIPGRDGAVQVYADDGIFRALNNRGQDGRRLYSRLAIPSFPLRHSAPLHGSVHLPGRSSPGSAGATPKTCARGRGSCAAMAPLDGRTATSRLLHRSSVARTPCAGQARSSTVTKPGKGPVSQKIG